MAIGPILPYLIKPLYYYLAIQVYLEGYLNIPPEKLNTFKGTVRLLFQPQTDTHVFYLNYDMMEIQNSKLYTPDNVTIPVTMKEIPEDQVLEFRTDTPLMKNKFYLIELNYKGKMRMDGSEGLFVGKHGAQSYASTKFEPHYARRMVPCIDQPDAKAIWKITVIHPKQTRAISNSERVKLIERKGWALTKFADTPKLSPYLLAIFVSNFKHFSGATKSGIKVRLFAPNFTIPRYKAIFEHSIRSLDFYTKYFDTPPMLEKLAGMENHGLISLNARTMDTDNKLTTVSHEISHHWIGNQATPKWWDDIWISEGLATFLSEHLPHLDKVFQLYQSMRTLLEYERALDANQGILLPLRTEIGWEELKRGRHAVLNYNVYNRGAMFMAMLHATMGTDSFRKATQLIVKNYINGTITTKDFYNVYGYYANATDSPRDFERFCKSWVEQAGHPLVNVRTVVGGVELSQERDFNSERIHPKYRAEAPFNYKYDIPIFYTTNTNEGNLVWLNLDDPTLFIPVGEDDIISVDPFGEGLYKVHYDRAWYEKWAKMCPEKKCQQDLFFKPCEEFLRVQMSYPLELRQKVIQTCGGLDHGFNSRHPHALRIA
ncbi:unnamed protein product, partial [Mesorhabditis spiculigera]